MNCFTHTYTGEPIPPKSPPYIPNFGTPCKTGKRAAKATAYMDTACQIVIMTPEQSRATTNIKFNRI